MDIKVSSTTPESSRAEAAWEWGGALPEGAERGGSQPFGKRARCLACRTPRKNKLLTNVSGWRFIERLGRAVLAECPDHFSPLRSHGRLAGPGWAGWSALARCTRCGVAGMWASLRSRRVAPRIPCRNRPLHNGAGGWLKFVSVWGLGPGWRFPSTSSPERPRGPRQAPAPDPAPSEGAWPGARASGTSSPRRLP